MPKVLIVYDSQTGNTEIMARAVADGAKEVGVDVEIKKVTETRLSDLKDADGIIFGTPTHYGTMSDRLKSLITASDEIRGDLENKIGAAFTSCGDIGGGGETTIMSLIQAMLIHGMLVVGDPMEATGHYGAIAIGTPDEEEVDICRKLGRRVAELVERIA